MRRTGPETAVAYGPLVHCTAELLCDSSWGWPPRGLVQCSLVLRCLVLGCLVLGCQCGRHSVAPNARQTSTALATPSS